MTATADIRWDGIDNAYIPTDTPVVSDDLKLHSATAEIDPFLHEVLRHNLWNINDEIGTTIIKVSGSPIAYTAEDFSSAILLENGEYLYTGHRNQLIAGTMDLMVKWVMENRSEQPGIHDGDMFLGNDPWIGTMHQQDVLLMCPVFWDGELFCWVACALHQYDIGGSTPGGFCPDAEDVFMEAVTIPPVKIVEEGRLLPDVEQFYLRHSRMRDLVALDLRAQVAANTMAKERIITLLERYGADVVKGTMRKIVSDAETTFRTRLETLPDGIFRGRSYLEAANDGDRNSYPVELQMEKTGGRLVFTMDGTADQAGALNFTFAAWRSAIMTAVNPVLAHDLLYASGGVLRCIDFVPRPGTISCARFPASVSNPQGGAVLAGGLAVNAVSNLVCLDPELAREAFATGGVSTFPIDSFAGVNQWGVPYGTILLDPMLGATGGFTFRDGTNTGGVWWVPTSIASNVEDNEQNYPLLWLYRKEWVDSGGAGRFRGGNSGCGAYVAHKTDRIDHSIATNGLAFPTSGGLFGGLPASPSRVRFKQGTDVQESFTAGRIPVSMESLAGDFEFPRPKQRGILQGEHDVMEMTWGAGGGVGDPLDREPRQVAEDVARGEISAEWALRRFGVVVRDGLTSGAAYCRNAQRDGRTGQPDDAATAAERDKIRQARLAGRPVSQSAPLADGGEIRRRFSLWEIVDYAEYADGSVVARCARCQTTLSTISDPSYKGACIVTERDLVDAVPHTAPPGRFIDDRMILREFCCPGCARLLATEVAREADEILTDIELRPEVK